jgi:hypothetical protein
MMQSKRNGKGKQYLSFRGGSHLFIAVRLLHMGVARWVRQGRMSAIRPPLRPHRHGNTNHIAHNDLRPHTQSNSRWPRHITRGGYTTWYTKQAKVIKSMHTAIEHHAPLLSTNKAWPRHTDHRVSSPGHHLCLTWIKDSLSRLVLHCAVSILREAETRAVAKSLWRVKGPGTRCKALSWAPVAATRESLCVACVWPPVSDHVEGAGHLPHRLLGAQFLLRVCVTTSVLATRVCWVAAMAMSIGGWLRQGGDSQGQAGAAAAVSPVTPTCIPVNRLVDTLPPGLLRHYECPVCFEIVG